MEPTEVKKEIKEKYFFQKDLENASVLFIDGKFSAIDYSKILDSVTREQLRFLAEIHDEISKIEKRKEEG